MYSFSLLGTKLRKKNETAKFLQPFVRVYENIFVPLPLTMNQLTRLSVWLSRLNHCRGFGIQSPTDYWMVRYVINEHWPYYQYSELGRGDNWLRRKLGRLYFRLANWRQPSVIVSSDYGDYWQAGCRRATVTRQLPGTIALLHTGIGEADRLREYLHGHVDDRSVVVVEGLWHDRKAWRRLTADDRVRITFDLYYCGILLFDHKRTKQDYVINF